MNITKGTVEVKEVFTRGGTDSFLKVTVPDGESICNITTRNMERAEGNAKIIAEAINVTNQCGLTPKELLEQRNQLREVMRYIEPHIIADSSIPLNIKELVHQLLIHIE